MALVVSIAARENIIRRFLEAMDLEPKHSERRFSHTTADILVPDVDNHVAFYSGCAPTDRQENGVVSLTRSSKHENAFWWHGNHTGDCVGGMPWTMDACAHAMPVTGESLEWTKTVVETMGKAGHRIENGYVKLEPIMT